MKKKSRMLDRDCSFFGGVLTLSSTPAPAKSNRKAGA